MFVLDIFTSPCFCICPTILLAYIAYRAVRHTHVQDNTIRALEMNLDYATVAIQRLMKEVSSKERALESVYDELEEKDVEIESLRAALAQE